MDNSFLIDLAVSVILSLLKQVVKNPAKKAQMRKVFLKVFNATRQAYPNDPDFE